MKRMIYIMSIMCCIISYGKKMSVDLESVGKLEVRSGRESISGKLRRELSINDEIEKELKKSVEIRLIEEGSKYIGTRYKWGGNGYKGIDCSGLTKRVYSSVGINLPRVSREQARVGIDVDPRRVKKGDLLYFATKKNRPDMISHVGIYVGNGEMLHASSSKGRVEKLKLKGSGILKQLKVIKRVIYK